MILTVLNTIAFAGRTGGVVFAEQADSPARLIETTHGTNDFLVSAKLKNQSSRAILSYRIGWAYIGLGKKPDVRYGMWMNVPASIAPNSICDVPDQNVPPNLDANLTVFFVAEIKFVDKTSWHVNVKDIITEAKLANKSLVSTNHE
jgi:hypothetical protein